MGSHQHLLPRSKPWNGHLSLVLRTLFFVLGLCLGIFTSSCLKSFPFSSLRTSLSSISPSVSPAQPSPSLTPPRRPEPSMAPSSSNGTPVGATLGSSPTISREEKASNNQLMHEMSEEELWRRASLAPRTVELPPKVAPKVAFMFLIKGPMPLAPLWEMFFEGHEGRFSVYVHPHPSLQDSLIVPETSVFYRRTVPSKEVKWGTPTMIDAERRLLANALLDFSNQRFILLSESCIPLFNFTAIYDHLMGSNLNFVGSFDDPRPVGRGRYNQRMWPAINVSEWRKGSQWFTVCRELAIDIITDRKYYVVFEEFCHSPCYMDEHYIATLVNILCPNLNMNRTITWVDWSLGGAHPGQFRSMDVSYELLNGIRTSRNCFYNGELTSMCFLFGRKFLPGSLKPLLSIAPMLFGLSQ